MDARQFSSSAAAFSVGMMKLALGHSSDIAREFAGESTGGQGKRAPVFNREFRRVRNHGQPFEQMLEGRKESVSFHDSFHSGEKQVRALRQRLLVNLRSATDKDIAFSPSRQVRQVIERWHAGITES